MRVALLGLLLVFASVNGWAQGLFLNEFLELHEKESPELSTFLKRRGWGPAPVSAPKGTGLKYQAWQWLEHRPNGNANKYTRIYFGNGRLYKTIYATNDPQEADAILNRMRQANQFLRKANVVQEGKPFEVHENATHRMMVFRPKGKQKAHFEFHLFSKTPSVQPSDSTNKG